MRLRVMTWNVHGFRAGTRQLAEAVTAEAPDVLVLNETGYLGFRLGRFARRAGMEGATGATLRWRIPNAVLARSPWRSVRGEVAVLPRTRKTIRRGVVMAVVGRAGYRLSVVAVHLGLSGEERVEHARMLTDLLAGREPLVLAGDLNEDGSAPAARWIADRYWDAAGSGEPTFPARDPESRIDYVFVSDGITVERTWTPREPFDGLSDHLPVLADLELAAAGG